MSKHHKEYGDDDGRTIADMSGVERPGIPGSAKDTPRNGGKASQPEPSFLPAWEEAGLNRRARRWYILGALKAALLIALVFLLGLGLLIAFLILVWS